MPPSLPAALTAPQSDPTEPASPPPAICPIPLPIGVALTSTYLGSSLQHLSAGLLCRSSAGCAFGPSPASAGAPSPPGASDPARVGALDQWVGHTISRQFLLHDDTGPTHHSF
jgi:hypothetical protein